MRESGAMDELTYTSTATTAFRVHSRRVHQRACHLRLKELFDEPSVLRCHTLQVLVAHKHLSRLLARLKCPTIRGLLPITDVRDRECMKIPGERTIDVVLCPTRTRSIHQHLIY